MFTKKSLTALLVFVLSISLIFTGCGSSNNSSSGTSKNETTASKETTKPTEAKKNVELSMWTWKVAYVPGFQAVSDEMEKKTGIKLKIDSFTPDQTYQQKVQAAANAGNLPDIVHWWATVPTYESFIDLQPFFDENFVKSFFPGSWNPVTVREAEVKAHAENKDANAFQKGLKAGQMFGVPLDVGGFFTFYGNKKIMQDAGLNPEAPKTWEEFLEMMKTIKAKTGIPGIVMAAKFPNLWQNWAGFALNAMYSGEEGLKALLTGNAKMSDPDNVKVLQALENLAKAGVVYPGCLNLDIDSADQVFAQGKVAFNLGGSFTFATLVNMGMKPEEFIAFPIPPLSGSKYDKWTLTPFSLTMLSVSKDTKNKDAAIEFLKYISTPDSMVLFANSGYSIPALNLGDKINSLNPSLKAILNSYSTKGDDPLSKISDVYPVKYGDPEWRVFDNNTQKILAGQMTAAQSAKEFDDARAKQKEANKNK